MAGGGRRPSIARRWGCSMNEHRPLDYAASPILSAIRAAAGETAAAALVAARGGREVYLPRRPTPRCDLARIVGLEAALAIVAALEGGRMLAVPTGRGLAHGRRIDPAEVQRLRGQGLAIGAIAAKMGCSKRQVWNILRRHRAWGDDPRQRTLFG